MSDLELTEQERAAFAPEITRNRALDYFYIFDDVPQSFVYRDKVQAGELTDLEKRNKTISETFWLDSYHQHLAGNVVYRYFYRGSVLQMVFHVATMGVGGFRPPAREERSFVATAEGVEANFEAWMAGDGQKILDEARQQPARAAWLSLLGVPDRSVRVVNVVPVGNQALLECISSWSEDGVLKETAWVVVALYDVDGTVLQDRSYIDLSDWPSANLRRRLSAERAKTEPPPPPPPPPETDGVLESFYAYHRSRTTDVAYSDGEKRNLAIVEGAWLAERNGGGTSTLHPARFRLQLPLQKCSCNLAVATDLAAILREAAPDSKIRLALTYAKGNQVAAEGVMEWTEDGAAQEAAFISFLLLDDDGLVIRERLYRAMGNWPAVDKLAARLGI